MTSAEIVFVSLKPCLRLQSVSKSYRPREKWSSFRRTERTTRNHLRTSTSRYAELTQLDVKPADCDKLKTWWTVLCFLGEPTHWEGADNHCRPVWNPPLQLQGVRWKPVQHGFGVHKSHADVWVPPASVCSRGAMSEPDFYKATVHHCGDFQDAILWMGFTRSFWYQEGKLGKIRTETFWEILTHFTYFSFCSLIFTSRVLLWVNMLGRWSTRKNVAPESDTLRRTTSATSTCWPWTRWFWNE